ncbi:superoxide dismutase [Flavisolibacter tropicus]|uniref:Superoxide dismutase n=1 Tax=Flavisolibacter tropicus TaxID=1492898 RepID=A0A172TV72_9BACT|nr:superoxide dismutase [Flavisolibacter tropicus]ANE50979.1 superoxide dismutase [Flavisolibacter tropicus]
MALPPSRRQFLIDSTKAGLGLYIGSGLLASCSTTAKLPSSSLTTGFQQQPLPYSYNALNEAIDATTMELHYSKHAAAYAKNLNEAASAENINTSQPLEEVMRRVSKYSAKVRNNGGGHYNHELFWKCMAPSGADHPSNKLATSIDSSFGSFDAFKKQLADAGVGRFGSGWAWLFVDGDKHLRIGSTPNQDNPLMDVSDIKGFPLLGLDVWEHAYYLRYQNKRADYINNWWKVVNWQYVQERFNSVV